MNKLFKFFMFLSIPLLSVMMVSCGEDEEEPEPEVIPVITAVNPIEGMIGDEIIITGTDLGDVTEVRFGTVAATGFNATDNQISVVVPEGVTAGAQTITVTNADGSDTFDFTVLEEEEPVVAPTITSFDPMEGPVGTAVTITGTGFVDENIQSLMIGEMVVEDFTVAEDGTTITFTIPEGAATGALTVTPVEGDAVVSLHSFTVTEVDPAVTAVTFADVVVNAQGVRNDEGMVTAFSAEGETFTLAEGTDEATSAMIDFIAADSGGDNGLDLFSPEGSDWLSGNYFEDSDDIPVVWPVRNLTKMVLLEDKDATFFNEATAEDIVVLNIGEEFETRIEVQPDADGNPSTGKVILFETAEGQKGILLYKGHNPNAEAGSKADIFTFDIKVLTQE